MVVAPKVLALAGTPATARRGTAFLAQVGADARIVAWHGPDPAVQSVDAVLATTVEALAGLPEVPIAVWVDSLAGLRVASTHGVEVPLTSRAELVDFGAVLVPSRGIDVGRYPVLPPLVRARYRLALGLPERLVVAVDQAAKPLDAATNLALVAAAVVTGPWLPLALALGTPFVTSPAAAQRFGLRPGLDVEVAQRPGDADRIASAIAIDQDRASALSRRGRRFAEQHLDLSHPARQVRVRLSLSAAPVIENPMATFESRLAELGTPDDSRLRLRLGDALAPFPTFTEESA